jgi:transaldolase
MFQDMTKKINESMAPMKELADIQTKMLEQLTQQQIDCAQSCVAATLRQTKELPGCASPEELATLQQVYAKALEEAIRASAEKNLEALNQARNAMDKLTQDAFNAFAFNKK